MSGSTISGSHHANITLTSQAYVNPIAVTGTITGLSTGYALFGQSPTAWTVNNSGTITGHGGIYLGASGTVINSGSVGAAYEAVDLFAGGTLTNQTGGVITSTTLNAVFVGAGAGMVVNYGSINSADADGVRLNKAGAVTNHLHGTIVGYSGVVVGGAATVVNDGSIGGTDNPGASGYGIKLAAGGSVTNNAAASITGNFGVVVRGGVGTVANYGSINSAKYVGVELYDAGSVTNATSASITAVGTGIDVLGGAGTVVNYGSITSSSGPGVFFGAGGTITNATSASITGYREGIFGNDSGSVTVVNRGRVTAAAGGSGVYLVTGGSVTNAASGSIVGDFNGVKILGGGETVVNSGSIGAVTAVVLAAIGSVTNAASASIVGSSIGVDLRAGGTLTNAGTIIGGTGGAVVLGGTGSNRLVLDPGFDFSGLVMASASGSNTLELASGGAAVGTLAGIGYQYRRFGLISVDATASWTLTGTNSLASGVTLANNAVLVINDATVIGAGSAVNDGLLVIDPSTVDLAAVTGTGTIAIGAFSTVDLQGSVAAGQTIKLVGTPDLLILGDAGQFSGTIDGFAPADIMRLSGITDVTSAEVITNNVLQVIESSGPTLDIQLGQSYPNPIFHHLVVGGSTNITVPCFLAGTRIATPAGERAIETLRIGDAVSTRYGGARPVKWIGRREYSAAEAAGNSPLCPILIAAGALADGVPRRALSAVSPMHALAIDGLFIPAAALVNGVSIRRAAAAGPLTYLHLEFAAHEVVLAEGAGAESFLDEHSRDLFDNAAEFFQMYGNAEPPPRRAPRTEEGYALEAVRRRLAARAGVRPEAGAPGPLLGHIERVAGGIAEGWVLDQANPAIPVELEAWHGGAWLGRVLANRYRSDLDRAGLGGGRCAFRLKLPPGAVLTDLAMRRATDQRLLPR